MLAACGAPQVRSVPACGDASKLVLGGQDDVDAAAGCRTVASVTIRTGAPLDLAPLAQLTVIRGELRVGPSVALDDMTLGALESADTIVIASNGNLHGVRLPKLMTAGRIAIEGNVALTTISLPALTAVRDLSVRGHGDLELLDISALTTVAGELYVADNPELTLFEAAALTRAGAIRLDNNASLDPKFVDALRSKIAP
ncbi:MAG TPA: hypothetical protein VK427_15815 [Kofleriaceae bacterium]|nr:hypothetical protein [Kofleriaceae bacterium]